MTKAEAQEYLKCQRCFCGNWKMEETAFCLLCLNVKITAQSRLDLERLEGAEFLQCLADCEKEIMKHKAELSGRGQS